MLERTLILASAIASLSGLRLGIAGAEEAAQPAATCDISWSHVTPEDERAHLWESLTWLPEQGQLVAIEKSCQLKTHRDGRFTLWRFAAEGTAISSIRIDERPADLGVIPLPRDIAGVFPLADGRLLVVGSVDVDAGVQFLWLDVQGNRLRSVELPEPKHPFSCHAIRKRERSLLLIGSASTGAFAVEANLEGEVLWHKEYREGKPNRYAETRLALHEEFKSAAVLADGKSLVMVGISGQLNEFGMGPADVWLVRCDGEGKLLNQRTIPGHPFASAEFADGKLAVLKESKGLFEYAEQKVGPWRCNLLIVDADLKTIHDEEMDLIAAPAMARTAGDRFVLAGRQITSGLQLAAVDKQETFVREYDAQGRVQRAMNCPIASLPFYPRMAVGDSQLFLATADWPGVNAKHSKRLSCISLPGE